MNQNRKTNQRRQRKTSQRNATDYYSAIDRTRDLNDGTVGTPQDRFERKTVPGPPTTIPKDFSRQGYWYRGSATLASMASSSVAPVSAGYSFSFSTLPLQNALSGVFDEYCIVQVTVRIMPSLTTNTTSSALPILQSVIDHDDANSLSSLTSAQEYGSLLETNGVVGHTRVIRPRVAVAAYSGSLFSAFANQRTYIDAASGTVPHYGLKLLATIAPVTITYTVVAELIVHLRDTH